MGRTLTNPYVWIVIGRHGLLRGDRLLRRLPEVTKQSHLRLLGRLAPDDRGVIALIACFAISTVSTPGLANKLAVPSPRTS
jgi:hypothetical protein